MPGSGEEQRLRDLYITKANNSCDWTQTDKDQKGKDEQIGRPDQSTRRESYGNLYPEGCPPEWRMGKSESVIPK
jgi:hypothetical protein